jgi:hypothetical protein
MHAADYRPALAFAPSSKRPSSAPVLGDHLGERLAFNRNRLVVVKIFFRLRTPRRLGERDDALRREVLRELVLGHPRPRRLIEKGIDLPLFSQYL